MTPSPVDDAAGRAALVIFDCDGVLVDSEAIACAVIAANLTRNGWAMTPDEARALFVGGTTVGVETIARERLPDLPAGWRDAAFSEVNAALHAVEAVPGVAAVLDALDAAGRPYCVGSNGYHDKMAITLAAAGLAERLAGKTFSSEDVARPKPAPDLFLHAAAAMGAPAAACVVVGDSAYDAAAARAAGMACLGFAPHDDGAALAAEGARVFRDMSALPALLGLAPA